MRLVAEDVLAEFPTQPITIETPCGPFQGVQSVLRTPQTPGVNWCAVSIMRSGDTLLETVREVDPTCSVGKLLIQRDETHPDKIAQLFYCKFPRDIANMYVLLCDPMLATGGSALTALNVLCGDYQVDPSKVIMATMICAPEGLRLLAETYPQVTIVTACVDQGLNEEKFIVPGLGDYGDRFFNTVDK